MSGQKLLTFQQFWPYYLGEHRSPSCRAWHYLGTAASIVAVLILLISQQWQWFWLVLIAGYGPAWIGHFQFEKNRPATFRHPVWSLLADYRMFGFALTGRLRQEYQKFNIPFSHQLDD